MSEQVSALFVMYLVAGYLYLWLGTKGDNASVDVRICIWLFWLPLLVWDFIKLCGRFLLRFFVEILEAFD